MFSLTQIKVRGFRGFVQEQEFAFDQPVVLLFGENHRGKSSTLNAVEWCLFGNECIGTKTGIRERVAWEIPNRYAPEVNVAVTVVFDGPQGSYTITREHPRRGSRASGTVTVLPPDGTKLLGKDAEMELHRLFRSSFQDFMTTVYQHQEAIRAIVTEEPRQRNEAIDRLLGLSQHRELLAGIDKARLEKTQKAMEGKFQGFRGRAEQSIRTLDSLIEEEKAKALDDGLPQEDIAEGKALRRAKEIGQAVASLAHELDTPGLSVPEPERFEQIMGFREWVKSQTDDLWAHAPDLAKQEELARKQQDLTNLSGRYKAARDREVEATQEKDAFVQQHGDETSLERHREGEQAQISQLDEQIRKTNERASLVHEAIQYLRGASPEVDKGKCPLCATEVPDLLAHLESEWEDRIRKQIEKLQDERDTHATRMEELEALRERLAVLQRDLETARTNLEACIKEAAAALEREIATADDPGSLINIKLQEIASDLESANRAIAQKREKISGIYSDLAKLRTIDEIINHERKKETVEHIFESEEFATVNELRNQASRFVEDTKAIRASIAAASQEEAAAKVAVAGAALSEYFRRITNQPAISGLTLEVAQDTRTGLNSYTFRSTDGSDPTPILSQGDLNCLALSLFLGLAQATGATQPFAFLMLDDPTQSLGSEMKQQFVRVLEDVANSRQLIIATLDPEFKELLINNVTKSKVVYNFLDWTKEGGPVVSKTA